MLAIGIDTGGTCTDAVIFDTEKHKVLAQSKTPTTRQDLCVGIIRALRGLDSGLISKASYISLSTTLATNACVETKGGRAKLLFIGVKPILVEKMRGEYGLPPVNEICFLPGDPMKEDEPEPDWESFAARAEDIFAGYDSVAVVQVNPKYNDGAYEERAASILRKKLNIPCVRGYELYQELNVQKRGATALLNARLLPVMEEFFQAIDRSLEELDIRLPIVIVRSDGSIMSRDFAGKRPVETLLCGPAASIIGAMELSDESDAMIVDMGGTTSDVAMIRNGQPVTAASGISIGEWKTMVKGVSIDTFALGGDTAVKYKGRELYLDQRRYISLCMLAEEYPEIIKKLKTLVYMDRAFSYPAGEFFLLVKEPEDLSSFTIGEQRFIKALAKGPLIYREAAEAARISPHVLNMQRLEDLGIVMRSGMTPTDAMHIRGDYVQYDVQASKLGAAYLGIVMKQPPESVCREIYDLVRCRLYSNLVAISMKYETGRDLAAEEKEQLMKLASYIFRTRDCDMAERFVSPHFHVPFRLIGIGGPTKVFLKDIAALMRTEAVFPEDGKVANAIGAAVGNVNTECVIQIEPYKGIRSSYLTYVITGGPKTFSLPEYTEAVEAAKTLAEEGARRRAVQQGASKNIKIEITVEENRYRRSRRNPDDLIETTVTARAVSTNDSAAEVSHRQ